MASMSFRKNGKGFAPYLLSFLCQDIEPPIFPVLENQASFFEDGHHPGDIGLVLSEKLRKIRAGQSFRMIVQGNQVNGMRALEMETGKLLGSDSMPVAIDFRHRQHEFSETVHRALLKVEISTYSLYSQPQRLPNGKRKQQACFFYDQDTTPRHGSKKKGSP